MKYDFGIRVDMGNKIGSGHFFRCLAIAKQLKKKKKNIVFIVKDKKNLLLHLKEKFPFYQLNNKSLRMQVVECKKLLKNMNMMIIDLPSHSELYASALSKIGKTTIIDDLGNKKANCDLLINGTIVKKFQKYYKTNEFTEICIGTKYLVLREDFYKNKNKFKVSKSIKKILLIYGGNDGEKFTYTVSEFLRKKGYFVTILLGPTYLKNNKVLALVKKHKNLKIKINVQNMSKLFIQHDLVICFVGITVYELACLGVPCIMIPSNKLQNIMANEIQKNGFGVNFGYLKNYQKLEEVISKMKSFTLRKKMYSNGRQMVDGKGLHRVTKILLSYITNS